MSAVPSGTVTFLFTDIEGSTLRWETDPNGMSEALAEHDATLRWAIEANGGVVFATGGDGFAAAFADAAAALRAAVESQDRVRLPVRMGLHTGTAEERDGNYFGRTVNRAARVMSAGHAGQIVVSDVTAALIRDDWDVTDLGEHRLAGVERPMRLWQVGGREFPPLRTSTALVGNLPVPLDSFVGRSRELAVLTEMITTHRLVTVVGVGGMGKTRLVIEACRRLQPHGDGGVWFADLALAQSGTAVVDEVASLFGLQAAPGKSVEERVIEHLEARTAVLVFDNCEHVMRPVAALIDRLLRACRSLRIVATSREALLLRGEHVMALGPLSMDDDSDAGGAGESASDAAELFVERLTAEGGPFTATVDRSAVSEICRQLDGMPLAIELAAARARTLGVSGVLAHLGERLRLLSGGWRTGAGRQHTLLATLDWSYVLLDDRERIVFDELAVFVGWFTVEDAVAVAGATGLHELDMLDALSALVDKSMCMADLTATPPRYRYLETMRSYGREHLMLAGTLTEVRDRHAAHVAAAALRVRDALIGPAELDASRHAERLTPDLRAALGWAVDRRLGDVVDAVAGLALVLSLRGSYETSGWCYEIRHDLDDRVPVLEAAITYALYSSGDLVEARRLCQRLLEITGARSFVGWANLGFVEFFEGHFDQAVDCAMRAYEVGEQDTGDRYHHVLAPIVLAVSLCTTGRDATALVEQGLDRARAATWPTALSLAYFAAGQATIHTDPVASLEANNRAVALAAEVGNVRAEATAQNMVNHLQSALLSRAELATVLIRELRRFQRSGDTTGSLLTFSQTIELLNDAGRQPSAALICGWLDGRSGRNLQSVERHREIVGAVARSVGDDWDRLFRQGRAMSSTEVFDTACEALETVI